jgi:hypothetical protein
MPVRLRSGLLVAVVGRSIHENGAVQFRSCRLARHGCSLRRTSFFFGVSAQADEVVDDPHDSKESDEDRHRNEHGATRTRRVPDAKHATR